MPRMGQGQKKQGAHAWPWEHGRAFIYRTGRMQAFQSSPGLLHRAGLQGSDSRAASSASAEAALGGKRGQKRTCRSCWILDSVIHPGTDSDALEGFLKRSRELWVHLGAGLKCQFK